LRLRRSGDIAGRLLRPAEAPPRAMRFEEGRHPDRQCRATQPPSYDRAINQEDLHMRMICAALAVIACSLTACLAIAQPASAQSFEKKNYNYSEWTKGRFSEAVTVTGPGKMIFLAGVGAEDENGKGGDILHKGDFTAQCKYAFDKIKRALEKNGATFGDIVKMVTYMTDVRYQPDFGKCRQETFGSTPMPAHTLLTISQLAWPGMMVEIDVTAMVPVK
jgi:enamine deaminase RidA (YjgF/YER057c/UK114 family)